MRHLHFSFILISWCFHPSSWVFFTLSKNMPMSYKDTLFCNMKRATCVGSTRYRRLIRHHDESDSSNQIRETHCESISQSHNPVQRTKSSKNMAQHSKLNVNKSVAHFVNLQFTTEVYEEVFRLK